MVMFVILDSRGFMVLCCQGRGFVAVLLTAFEGDEIALFCGDAGAPERIRKNQGEGAGILTPAEQVVSRW